MEFTYQNIDYIINNIEKSLLKENQFNSFLDNDKEKYIAYLNKNLIYFKYTDTEITGIFKYLENNLFLQVFILFAKLHLKHKCNSDKYKTVILFFNNYYMSYKIGEFYRNIALSQRCIEIKPNHQTPIIEINIQ